jgi:hypothetical protein
MALEVLVAVDVLILMLLAMLVDDEPSHDDVSVTLPLDSDACD